MEARRRQMHDIKTTVRKIKRSLSNGARMGPNDGVGGAHSSAVIFNACRDGDERKVEDIVKNSKVRVDGTDWDGKTILHYACQNGWLGVVQELVKKHVEVNTPDLASKSPLMEAQEAGHEPIVAFLRTHGAVDSEKYTEKLAKTNLTKKDQGGAMETGDVVDHSSVTKLIFFTSLPFILLIVYQGPLFILCFLTFSTAWVSLVAAYLISELSISPPWYHPTPGKDLCNNGIPPYWQGIYTNPKYDLSIEYEEVSFRSEKYILRGWWIPGKGKTCILFVHGGGRDRRAWLRHVKLFHGTGGYPCFMFDFREHGASDGHGRGFTYGIKESRDVVQAAKWVRKEYEMDKVVVVGTSVGGSAAILAAVNCVEIDVVISENPLTYATSLQNHHFQIAVKNFLGTSPVVSTLAAWFTTLPAFILKLRIGFLSEEAVDVIPRLKQPVLLMHGTGDEVIPLEHSEALFNAANEPKELWIAPEAFHCGLYDRYPDIFAARTMGFIKKYT
eukprot:TRINITY_DN11911_c0_g1_i1.p1 TRINITY_DN11911_c0_g1~~TRINITY_DN11911_c0_g1_i1.p1  ORF type:complete len:500 (+),score=68.93 TRINITY_DN11911_c0_g1_i1:144-1643(+)